MVGWDVEIVEDLVDGGNNVDKLTVDNLKHILEPVRPVPVIALYSTLQDALDWVHPWNACATA